MKKYWLVGGISAAGYLALLKALVLAEAAAPESTIHTMGQAAWYSLVTLTTVGYGDYSPVTAAGRLIGVVFLALSTGLTALLLGFVVSFLSGSLLPKTKLWLNRKKHWYVFDCQSAPALALADHLQKEEPKALVLFADGEVAEKIPGRYGLALSLRELEKYKKEKSGCNLFYMSADETQNYLKGCRAAERGFAVCCKTSFQPDSLPAGVTLFSEQDCRARLYWQEHPLTEQENTLVLIGCGKCAARLLERALLVNVYGFGRKITYHVFENSSEFERNHFALCSWLEHTPAQTDRVIFHRESWNENPELLKNAHRIILAQDEFSANMELFKTIKAYFPTKAAIHVYAPAAFAESFGSETEIYTPALVMKKSLNRIAAAMHEIYLKGSGADHPRWEELTPFYQASNIASADHLLTKVRILLKEDGISALTKENCSRAFQVYRDTQAACAGEYRRIEHERWLRFYLLNNWQQGDCKDQTLRLHPDMKAFDRLSPEEQEKDDYAWQLLEAVSRLL